MAGQHCLLLVLLTLTVVVPPDQLDVTRGCSSEDVPDEILFRGVQCPDCHLTSDAPVSTSIVHQAREVIWQAIAVDHGCVISLKLAFSIVRNILPKDLNMVISVGAALLVVNPKSMDELMLNDSCMHAAIGLQAERLGVLVSVS